MTSRCYFGKMNSILGSVVPLAMFLSHRPGGVRAHNMLAAEYPTWKNIFIIYPTWKNTFIIYYLYQIVCQNFSSTDQSDKKNLVVRLSFHSPYGVFLVKINKERRLEHNNHDDLQPAHAKIGWKIIIMIISNQPTQRKGWKIIIMIISNQPKQRYDGNQVLLQIISIMLHNLSIHLRTLTTHDFDY